jgi:hypothetical protein
VIFVSGWLRCARRAASEDWYAVHAQVACHFWQSLLFLFLAGNAALDYDLGLM